MELRFLSKSFVEDGFNVSRVKKVQKDRLYVRM